MSSADRKATHSQIKCHNKRFILKTIYDQGEISRADIARTTQLTRPTVSTMVSELMNEGLVVEVGQMPSEGGKPATLLSMNPNSRHLIGIDLANSEFRGALLNLRGEATHRVSLPTHNRNGKAALSLVYHLIDKLIAAADNTLLGIGIGTPGLINVQEGIICQAVNLDWQNLALRDILQERYNLPVYVANDSQAAALGEYTFGDRKDIANLVVVKVGRGIGAGIILNGRLYYGDDFGAGEIGHVKVVENGELCRCGHHGCLETVASSRKITKEARIIFARFPDSPLHQLVSSPEDITITTVLKAYKKGDPNIPQMINQAGRYLGQVIANLIVVLNIHHIVIAGSMAGFGESLLRPIRQVMHEDAYAELASKTEVSLSHLGPDIVMQGAAALLLSSELGIV